MALILLLVLLAAELGAAAYLKNRRTVGVSGPTSTTDRDKLKAGGRRIADMGRSRFGGSQ